MIAELSYVVAEALDMKLPDACELGLLCVCEEVVLKLSCLDFKLSVVMLKVVGDLGGSMLIL